jgi:hypothetical protein
VVDAVSGRRIASILVLGVSLVGLSQVSASEPIELAGEELTNSTEDWTTIFGAEAAERCDRRGAVRLPFTLEGRATGPFPGTFTEHGFLVVGPRTPTISEVSGIEVGSGPVLAFWARFTIRSGDNVIEGKKWGLPSAEATRPFVKCGTFVDAPSTLNPGWRFTGSEVASELSGFEVRYRATVTSPRGTWTIRGRATTFLRAQHTITTHCPLPPPVGCSSESSAWGGAEQFD